MCALDEIGKPLMSSHVFVNYSEVNAETIADGRRAVEDQHFLQDGGCATRPEKAMDLECLHYEYSRPFGFR